MVIILTFLIILSIGAVSASEDSDNALSFSNDNSILEATPGTFTDLASDLSGKTEVTLERNYTYVTEDNLVNGIGINSEITIDGAGYTINGSDLARIFIITGENYQITLKNINFVNGKSDKGGAILQNANNQAIDISVINCTFKYNDVTGSGGAIYARSTGKFIFENNTFENNTANAVGALYAPKAEGLYYNNTFINNTASTGNGGAVQLGDNTIVNKSTFKNNRAAKNGGGLNIGKNSKVLNSNFTNNSAEQGGAIYAGEECTVLNCLFDGNNATNHAGAVLVALNSQISYSNFTNNIATNNGGGLNTAANCNVSYCNFNENSANQGGAIYSGEKAAILNCTFEGNDAYVGGGAIYLSKNSNVLNCNFTQNEVIVDPTIVAKGGAIFINQNANNVNITNCRFIENEAYSGAAIRLEAAYINISHSVFEENHAHGGKINDVNTVEAGAILIQDPGKCSLIEYCNFTSNYANATGHKDSYGGAIRNRAQNTTINHCNFISNIAYHNAGGAIESSGANLKINDSYFEDNTAHSDGGALYLHASANDVVLITNSRFVNNRVSEDQPCKTGGAILLRQPGNYNNRLKASIINCSFEDNVAPSHGGGLCIRSNNGYTFHTDIVNCNFTGNNATWGSAISLYSGPSMTLDNVIFGKNRANSSELNIDVINPISYYPGNVTVNVTFKGMDNIANAIWNGGNTTDRTKGDVNHVLLRHVTYEIYQNGELNNITTPDEFVNPKDGYANSNNGNDIWQDDLENAQKLSILIVPEAEDTGGILSASIGNQDVLGAPVLNVTGDLTDINGNITPLLQNLAVGKYKVYARHFGDAYYTDISNSNEFEVIDLLNVTKSPKYGTEYLVGETVEYEILIENNGDEKIGNLTVVENPPKEFDPEFNISSEDSQLWTKNGNTLTYNGVLNPNANVTLTLYFTAIKKGKNITNYIDVSSNITNPRTVPSDNISVYVINASVTKVIDKSPIYIGDQAVFTINITNTGDWNLTGGILTFTDEFDENLILDHFENITHEVIYNEGGQYGEFYVPPYYMVFDLNANESAIIKFYFNTTKEGTFDNNVSISIYGEEVDNSTANVTVEKIPTHISIGNITAHPRDNVTIPVNVTSDDGVPFNGEIDFTLPDGSIVPVEIVNGTGNVPWTVPDGYEGDYPDNASFDGNITHLPSNGTGIVSVEKIPTHISVGNVSAHPRDNVTIPVNVTADDGVPFNGNITVTLPDGSDVTVEIVDGSGSVPWTVPDGYEGDYPVNASFPGDGRYLPSNGTGIVSVEKIPTHISVGNVSAHPRDNVTIPVNVTADDGVPFNGNITVTLPDGSDVTVEIVDGSGSVPWTVPDGYEGDYPVNASFPGDGRYLPSNGTGIVTVEKIPTHISVSNVTARPGDDITIDINVTADDDVPFNGNITVTLPDGSNQTVVIVNGSGSVPWSVPDDYEGDYPVTASFPGDGRYLPSDGTGVVTVIPKVPTEISVGNITTYPGEDIVIPVNVTTGDDIPFNGNITVTLPDGSNKTVEIINGSGEVPWTVLDDYEGDYPVNASFPGDDNYLPSNGTGIVTVVKVPTQITVGNITTNPGTEITIPINVTTDDGIPFNGNITINFPDGTNKTVEIVNGTGNTTWYVPDDYSPDVYNDTVSFGGDNRYLPSQGNGTITVIVIPTHISVGNITAHPGEDISIPINVTSDDDVPFNGNITVTLPDGSNVTVEIVNGSGNVPWTVPVDYDGDYPVTATYPGTNKYLPSNGTGIVTVVKVPTHVDVENITTKPGKEITIPINVTGEDDKPITGNVTVELPDGSNQTVEIINGTGNTTWTVPDDYEGDYNYTVEYEGNETYLPSNSTGVISVVKVPVKIIVGNVTAHPGDNVIIPIEVIPEDGSVFNGNVTVTLPDGTTKVVEIINGKGNVDWTVPEDYVPGDYMVIVTFDGDDVYYSAIGTGFITVIVEVPQDPENPPVIEEVPMDNKTTGNPLVALLAVLALLGIGIKRKN